MTSLNISLPEPMKEFIEGEVKRGAYSTPSEFVRELVREAQKRHTRNQEERLLEALVSGESLADAPELERLLEKLRAQIDAKLLQALRGGEATDMTARDWSDIRARVLGKATRKGGAVNGRARKKARGGRR